MSRNSVISLINAIFGILITSKSFGLDALLESISKDKILNICPNVFPIFKKPSATLYYPVLFLSFPFLSLFLDSAANLNRA